MNKLLVLLGAIVLITLGLLFFCIGFFTGSNKTTISTTIENTLKQKTPEDSKKITNKDLSLFKNDNTKSATLSDKIIKILNAAGNATDTFSKSLEDNKKTDKKPEISPTKPSQHNKYINPDDQKKLHINTLLREIASSHPQHDDCSYHNTMIQMHAEKPIVDKTLQGKKIVFIGYFKTNIAVQIQKLLAGKGYKIHLELSRSSEGNEAFVFCGPFRKDKNAKLLLKWLLKHNFSEARIVNITREEVEETLFDISQEAESIPENAEHDPEMTVLHRHNTVGVSNKLFKKHLAKKEQEEKASIPPEA